MSQETAKCTGGYGGVKQDTFVNILRGNPVLLDKSQLPSMKIKKGVAMEALISEYQQQSGKKLTEKQAAKKINNMKNVVKKKADTRQTGNKPVNLEQWEKDFLDLVQAESNPSFSQVAGKQ
jgi:hypothetical protein